MSPWASFYEGRVTCPRYLQHVNRKYGTFLRLLLASIKPGDRVVEAGCGMATISTLLCDAQSEAIYKGFDICTEMLLLARQQIGDRPITLTKSDVRHTMARADVIHSHGVLEHFSDADIRTIIAVQRDSGARTAIHYVPGNKYETPSFGDERLMTTAEWVAIAQPSIIYTFNSGYDYALVWNF